ncbi:MAG: potassium channel protein [Candidatus Nezhaarchaeota archaeon]|nr:potassium channel protein [Candidatus Nezhaarchaeota archaeon]MCX8141420.1 potassium channel protein [Candidatus Nezhaarchaeota archaeon]MDW8049686.1 TrkA C-terminal domain-containing protein [Nitrososphaerota archaeon]
MSRDLLSDIRNMLIELKNVAEFMVDLAYTAILTNSKELAEEVERLEEYVDDLHTRYEMAVLELSKQSERPAEFLGTLRVGLVVEALADAALEMVQPVLRGDEPHEILTVVLSEAEEAIGRVRIEDESSLIGKSSLELKDEGLPVAIVAIRRGTNWILHPGEGVKLHAGDILVVKGRDEDLKKLRALARGTFEEE